MKKLLFLGSLLLLLANSVTAQKFTNQSFSTALGDMKAQVGTNKVLVSVNGLSVDGDDNPGFYRWDSSSTATDNGFTVIQVTGVTTGRWLRIPNSNTIKGTFTGNGTGLATTFTIPYGTTFPFVPVQIQIQPRTANAIGNFIPIGGITNTGFTISFQTIPILGSNNITFDYLIIKQ